VNSEIKTLFTRCTVVRETNISPLYICHFCIDFSLAWTLVVSSHLETIIVYTVKFIQIKGKIVASMMQL